MGAAYSEQDGKQNAAVQRVTSTVTLGRSEWGLLRLGRREAEAAESDS